MTPRLFQGAQSADRKICASFRRHSIGGLADGSGGQFAGQVQVAWQVT
jgi:hypothetical protein